MRNKIIRSLGITAVVSLLGFGGMMVYADVTSPFPQDAVLGLIGSAHATCKVPANTAFSGPDHSGGLAGCSYQGLAEGPLAASKHFSIASAAQAASFTYDVPGTGWKGWDWQLDDLLGQTTWFDGPGGSPVSRLKAVYLSIPGDCGRTVCTQDEINAYYDRVQGIVDRVKGMGKLAIVEEYPSWDHPAVNLAMVASLYGFPPITKEYYNNLRQGHIDRFSHQTGVLFVNPYDGDRYETMDGFHPTPKSAQKIGKYLEPIIADALGL